MNWTGREAKFCPANFKLGRNSAAGEGQGWDNVGGDKGQAKERGMKTPERERGEGCRAKHQLFPPYLVAPSRFTAHILLYWGGKMSATEEAGEFLFGFFSSLLGCLQQQETQEIFLNKAWNWLFAFCL